MNAWHRAGRSIGRRVAALATLILLIGGIPSAQASPGDLDTGFSSDGKVLTDIGTADSGRAVAIQADGKVVVAGNTLLIRGRLCSQFGCSPNADYIVSFPRDDLISLIDHGHRKHGGGQRQ